MFMFYCINVQLGCLFNKKKMKQKEELSFSRKRYGKVSS